MLRIATTVAWSFPVMALCALSAGCRAASRDLRPSGAPMEVRRIMRPDSTTFLATTWWPGPTANLTLRDAVATDTGDGHGAGAALERFREQLAAGSDTTAAGSRTDEVLGRPLPRAPMDSMEHAPWPVVMLMGGVNTPAWFHARLGALLASRGFVAVSLPSGSAAGRGALRIDSAGVRAQREDLLAALAALRRWRDVDVRRVVLAAWSTGGIATALASGEPGVRGFASLDAATGYAYGDSLLQDMAGSQWRWRRPYLHLHAGVGGPVAQSRAFLGRGCGTFAWRAPVEGAAHRHFTSLWSPPGLPAATDQGSSWERLVVEFARTATRDREPTLLGAARPVALPACPR